MKNLKLIKTIRNIRNIMSNLIENIIPERKLTHKKTNKIFIQEATVVHGDNYSYENINYLNAHTKVEIYCKTCKVYFMQIARIHLRGSGCITCGIKKRGFKKTLTQEEFLRRAKDIHGDKYDYSEFVYEKAILKGKIKCNTCSHIFEQTPHHHIGIKRTGCPKCGIKKTTDITRKTLEEFVNKSKEVHGDLYNYDKVLYTNHNTEVEILCIKCNEYFFQSPAVHLRGCGCKKCGCETAGLKLRLSQEEFIEKCVNIHGDKYDYTNTIYVKGKDKVNVLCLTCKKEFELIASDHLYGNGCRACGYAEASLKLRLTQEDFLERCYNVHGNKYDYSKTIYVSGKEKLEILCLKCNKEFTVTGKDHIGGSGCFRCKFSKGEIQIEKYLDNLKLEYTPQKTFDGCKNIILLHFDFYVQSYNLCIEYDGKQHSFPIEFFGGEEAFNKTQLRDKIKTEFCEKNNINLLRINYDENIIDKLNSFFDL